MTAQPQKRLISSKIDLKVVLQKEVSRVEIAHSALKTQKIQPNGGHF
jgi:hypothetical protein